MLFRSHVGLNKPLLAATPFMAGQSVRTFVSKVPSRLPDIVRAIADEARRLSGDIALMAGLG